MYKWRCSDKKQREAQYLESGKREGCGGNLLQLHLILSVYYHKSEQSLLHLHIKNREQQSDNRSYKIYDTIILPTQVCGIKRQQEEGYCLRAYLADCQDSGISNQLFSSIRHCP